MTALFQKKNAVTKYISILKFDWLTLSLTCEADLEENISLVNSSFNWGPSCWHNLIASLIFKKIKKSIDVSETYIVLTLNAAILLI